MYLEYCDRYENNTAIAMKNTVFWNVTPFMCIGVLIINIWKSLVMIYCVTTECAQELLRRYFSMGVDVI